MKKDVLNFILEEKRFSEFKIKTLERTSSPHKLRLIKREREFVSFEFSSLNLRSRDEARLAMNLFRISKSEFLKKYKLCDYKDKFRSQCQFILDKIKDIKIDDIGIIDGHSFSSLSNSNIFNGDGTIRSKYNKFLSMCRETLSLIYSFSKKNERLPKDIFEVFQFIPDSSTKIPFLSSNFKILESENFDSIIHKTESTSLLITDMCHQGNEKINIVYCRFFDNFGKRVCPKKDKFVNVSIDGSYYKSVMFDRADSEKIDLDSSMVAVGKSRRFSEQLLEIKVWAKIILLEVEEI